MEPLNCQSKFLSNQTTPAATSKKVKAHLPLNEYSNNTQSNNSNPRPDIRFIENYKQPNGDPLSDLRTPQSFINDILEFPPPSTTHSLTSIRAETSSPRNPIEDLSESFEISDDSSFDQPGTFVFKEIFLRNSPTREKEIFIKFKNFEIKFYQSTIAPHNRHHHSFYRRAKKQHAKNLSSCLLFSYEQEENTYHFKPYEFYSDSLFEENGINRSVRKILFVVHQSPFAKAYTFLGTILYNDQLDKTTTEFLENFFTANNRRKLKKNPKSFSEACRKVGMSFFYGNDCQMPSKSNAFEYLSRYENTKKNIEALVQGKLKNSPKATHKSPSGNREKGSSDKKKEELAEAKYLYEARYALGICHLNKMDPTVENSDVKAKSYFSYNQDSKSLFELLCLKYKLHDYKESSIYVSKLITLCKKTKDPLDLEQISLAQTIEMFLNKKKIKAKHVLANWSKSSNLWNSSILAYVLRGDPALSKYTSVSFTSPIEPSLWNGFIPALCLHDENNLNFEKIYKAIIKKHHHQMLFQIDYTSYTSNLFHEDTIRRTLLLQSSIYDIEIIRQMIEIIPYVKDELKELDHSKQTFLVEVDLTPLLGDMSEKFVFDLKQKDPLTGKSFRSLSRGFPQYNILVCLTLKGEICFFDKANFSEKDMKKYEIAHYLPYSLKGKKLEYANPDIEIY